MVAGSIASATIAAALADPAARLPIVLGMIGPLAATLASWVAIEHTYRQDPLRVTGVMFRSMGAKAVFFAAYVTVVIKGLDLNANVFVASLTGYLIGLYAAEAVLLRRLFCGAWRGARS
jgi:hypothetical protein